MSLTAFTIKPSHPCEKTSKHSFLAELFWILFFLTILSYSTLWSKKEKNTDKVAISSSTVLWMREWTKWASRQISQRVISASERANRQANCPVLQSGFLVILDHSAVGFLMTISKENLKTRLSYELESLSFDRQIDKNIDLKHKDWSLIMNRVF